MCRRAVGIGSGGGSRQSYAEFDSDGENQRDMIMFGTVSSELWVVGD
jgi:hypothetical protein